MGAMGSVSAVVTTGIYCREGCSGRPLSQNRRMYPSAAAAEAAGFRACHLCRPYRVSTTTLEAAPELVCHAVRLIESGALDDSTESSLANQLGVSARHLRRLFAAYVGTTPANLARSRRAHFARRLLDETDLSVTQVAFSAGFGSVRQFNRTMSAVFGEPPSTLRGRRRRGDPLTSLSGVSLRLSPCDEVAWRYSHQHLSRRCIPGLEATSTGIYRRTITTSQGMGEIAIREDRAEDALILTVDAPDLGGLMHIADQARSLVGLNRDPRSASAHLRADPHLGPLIRGLADMRPVGCWDPFESGVRAIVGQQVSVASASSVLGRIVELASGRTARSSDRGLDLVFPTPGQLAAVAVGDLPLPAPRAAALGAFCEAVLDGTILLDGSQPYPDLVEALQSVPGIGPWTAEYIALRWGCRDAFPAGDLALRRVLGVTAGELLRLSESWRPWRAYAATYLWALDVAARSVSTCV